MNKSILHTIFSYALVAVLFVPTLQQGLHALEEHEHSVCTDASTHYHKTDTDCDLHDFQLNPVTYFPQEVSNIVLTQAFFKKHWGHTSVKKTTPLFTYPLRGPPLS